MKKIAIYLLMTFVGLGFVSCREEENLFEGTPSERLHKYMHEIEQNLVAASNGWEMLYFPTPESQGYVFLARFKEDGTVTIAAKNRTSSNSQYKEGTSLWDIDANQSAVLTFHSYNDLFNIFASPLDDGIGYGGDYEFMVLKNTANWIKMKGKKSAAYIEMNRLENDLVWERYYDNIDKFEQLTFAGNNGIEMLYTAGDSVLHLTYENGVFSYKIGDSAVYRGTIITPQGLRFYSSAPDTEDARDFVINDAMNQLVCTTNPNVYLYSAYDENREDYMMWKFDKKARWKYVAEGSDIQTQAAVNKINQKVQAKGATINKIAFEKIASLNARGIKQFSYALYISYLVEGKVFEGHLDLNFSQNNHLLTFSYKAAGKDIQPLLARINDDTNAAAQEIATIFCDTYACMSYNGGTLNLVEMLLQSQSKNSKKIHIIVDNTDFSNGL